MIIDEIVRILRKNTKNYIPPLIDQIITEYGKDPYLILIACLLSLRAKDVATIHVCRKLFSQARTPRAICNLSRKELEQLVYKSGFYRTKARILHEVSAALIQDFDGKVPQTIDELLSIKGIGIKTAHLVMGKAFDTPALCVDTHVHRISNRLGLIQTKTVEQTEHALRHVVPKKYWIEWNKLLVIWGQNVCVPISPWCSRCALTRLCKRKGVKRYR